MSLQRSIVISQPRSYVFKQIQFLDTTTIQLVSDTGAILRGVVIDQRGRAIAGASISIAGYSDATTTDSMGNFVLSAHAAVGQIVEVRAKKDKLATSMSVPAGRTPVELVLKGY